jgi:predicted Rdx family selenoprotein
MTDWRKKVEGMERISTFADFLKECALVPSNAHTFQINPPIPQPGSIIWLLQQGDDTP